MKPNANDFHRLRRSHSPSQTIREPQENDRHATDDRDTNSEPELGSTVPDSEVERARAGEHSQTSSRLTGFEELRRKKMSQRSAASNDTEPISQSVFDSIAAKSFASKRAKDKRLEAQGRYLQSQDAATTQRTYEPGETGHIDLVSDLNRQEDGDDELLGGNDDDEDANPNFSPTQTQYRVSQYPDSQRFKTPGTAGKKRNIRGETIDSPSLPRIPHIRSAGRTPAKGLGLSQIFAATQAGTSPLTNKLPSDIRSDRPSPNIAVQTRPATSGSLSSPVLLRDVPHRNSSEPNTRYVSMQESQQQRDEQLARQNKVTSAIDDENSDSEDESSSVQRQRVEREKSRRRQDVFTRLREKQSHLAQKGTYAPLSPEGIRNSSVLSSPPSDLPSSPPHKKLRPNGRSQRANGQNSDEEEEVELGELRNDSEAETDQELALTTPAPKAFAQNLPGNEEDKENLDRAVVQVPDTANRLHYPGDDGNAQSSPSFRFPRNLEDPPSSLPPASHAQVAVADSQPSQGTLKTALKARGPHVPSSDDIREFVPQSQYPQPATSVPDAETNLKADNNAETDRGKTNTPSNSVSGTKIDPVSGASKSHPVPPLRPAGSNIQSSEDIGSKITSHISDVPVVSSISQNAVPETSSSRHQHSKSDDLADCVQRQSSAPPAIINDASAIDGSGSGSYETAQTHQQAMIASPNGTKRKAMTSFRAQRSPQDPTKGIDMNFDDMLNDQEYQSVIGSSSPIIQPGRLRKRRRVDPELASVEERIEKENGKLEDQVDQPRSATLRTPRSALKKPGRISKPAGEVWDVEPSPPPPPQPTIKSNPRSKGRQMHTRRSVTRSPGAVSAKRSDALQAKPPNSHVTNNISKATATSKSPRVLRSSAMPIASADLPSPTAETEPSITNESHTNPSHRTEAAAQAQTEITAPNRVFACFNGKIRAYYPATCLGMTADKTARCIVQWPGYEPDIVDAHGIRSLLLKVGDQVKVEGRGFPKVAYTVKGFRNEAASSDGKSGAPLTDVFGNTTLLIAPKQRKSLPVDLQSDRLYEVSINDIYLDTNMWKQLADRTFEYQGNRIAVAGLSTSHERPFTPIKQHGHHREYSISASADSSNPNAIFMGMTFAISYSDETRRHAVAKMIRSDGGRVLHDGFQQLFSVPSSAPATPTKRQKADSNQPSGLSLLPSAQQYSFAALIADKHSRKPKYMQALALGLPCLSGKWVERCVQKGAVVDWTQYLLPAGESIDLEGATKSRILPMRDPSTSSLPDMLDQGPKLFDGQSVVLVMPRRTAQEKGLTFSFLCQALSAARVLRMEDLKSAREFVAGQEGGQEIDWVVVDDKSVGSARATFEGTTEGKGKRKSGAARESDGVRKPRIVGAEYICQSLVLGSLWDE